MVEAFARVLSYSSDALVLDRPRYQSLEEASRVPYVDRNLTCVDCGASFVFSAEDQEFHAQKGYTNEPKRCPTCRAARRQTSGGGGSYGGGGGGGFGGDRSQ